MAGSSTVIIKTGLDGSPQHRVAMGLNEAAGYLAVCLTALGCGFIAAAHSLRPHLFYLGVAFPVLGLLLTLLFARDTKKHARQEALLHENGVGSGIVVGDSRDEHPVEAAEPRQTDRDRQFRDLLLDTCWRNRTVFSASQAEMLNNLNDGLAWGLFPVDFAAAGLKVERIGWLVALYRAVLNLGQLITGWLSDRTGRKPLIVGGMLVQAAVGKPC